MSPRPLVLHDAFAFPGGGELVAVTLARAFEADLLTGRFDPAARSTTVTGNTVVSSVNRGAAGRRSLASRAARGMAKFALAVRAPAWPARAPGGR